MQCNANATATASSSSQAEEEGSEKMHFILITSINRCEQVSNYGKAVLAPKE